MNQLEWERRKSWGENLVVIIVRKGIDRWGTAQHPLYLPLLYHLSKWGYLGKQNSVRYYTIISNKNDCRSVINAHNCEPDRLEISLMGKNCKNAENGFVIVLLIAPY